MPFTDTKAGLRPEFTETAGSADGDADPIVEKYGDAIIMTPYDEADHKDPITITVGANAQSTNWTPATPDCGAFVAKLCQHGEGSKDGPAFVLADMVPGPRLKNSVKALTGGGIDLDVGVPVAKVYDAVKELGCLAVVYTTHSHGKTATAVKKDTILKYIDKHAPGKRLEDNETIRWYLREAENWDESIVSTAVYEETDHTNKGIVVIIGHAPMPKTRIIIPFLQPFEIAKEGVTQAEAMKKWVQVPLALAAKLGLPLDKSGTDPSRLFYFPRHAKGRKFEIALFGGPLFDWRMLCLEKEAIEKLAEKITKGGPGKSKSKTEEGKKLGRWSVKRAHGFQIADVISNLAQENIRNGSGDKFEIICPFDENHSNAGDPEDKACFVANAASGQSELFTVSCRHDSCHGLTSLDHLGKMIKDGWFGEEVLEDEDYNALIDEELDAAADLERQVSELTKESTDKEVRALLKKLIALDDPLVEARLLTDIEKNAVRGKEGLKKTLKKLRQEEVKESETYKPSRDDAKVLADIAARFPVPSEHHGEFHYEMFEGRVWLFDGPSRLCTPVSFDARVVCPDGGGHYSNRLKYLRQDKEDGYVTVTATAAVAAKGSGLLVALRAAGISFTPSGEEFLVSHSKEVIPQKLITQHRIAGWRGEVFLTPWGDAVNTNEHVELDEENKPRGLSKRGSLDNWKTAVDTALRSGNIFIQIGVLSGFASPLLAPAGLDSVLLHLGGTTSQGKTTAQRLGASAWGQTESKEGLFFTFDATTRSVEALIERGSGCYAAFDEAHAMDPDDFHNFIYRVAGGTGTDRLDRNAKLKSTRKWSVFAVSSGELSVAEKIRASGRNPGTGVTTRVLEIAEDDAKVLSVDTMGKIESAYLNYGHAGLLFVKVMAEKGYARGDTLRKRIDKRCADLEADTSSAAKRRSVKIAAVLWVAGELAKEAGLIASDIDVGKLAKLVWKKASESEIAAGSDMDRAVESLCTALLMEKGNVESLTNLHDRNFLARRLEKYDGGPSVYVVPCKNLLKLAGGSVRPKAFAKELARLGMLLQPAEGHSWSYVKGVGNVSSYLILADAVEQEKPTPAPKEEAVPLPEAD